MNGRAFRRRIARGESERVEFKLSARRPEVLARAIAAFANTEGGYLLIGMTDDGRVVGVGDLLRRHGSPRRLVREVRRALLAHLAPRPRFRVRLRWWDGVPVLEIAVRPTAGRRPVRADGQIYLRQGTAVVRAGRDDVVARDWPRQQGFLTYVALGVSLALVLAVGFVWAAAANVVAGQESLLDPPPGGQDNGPHPSPDGRMLYFHRLENFDWTVWELDLVTGKARPLTPGRPEPEWANDVSPDGRYLALNVARVGGAKIVLYDLQTGRMRDLTDDNCWNAGASFSPDGEWILFDSDCEGEKALYRLHLQDGRVERLTPEGMEVKMGRYRPDGAEIVCVVQEGRYSHIALLPASGGTPQVLTHGPVQDGVPVWSPDERWIVFTRHRTQAPELWAISPDGGEPSPLTLRGECEPAFSPDGRWLYFSATWGPDRGRLRRMRFEPRDVRERWGYGVIDTLRWWGLELLERATGEH